MLSPASRVCVAASRSLQGSVLARSDRRFEEVHRISLYLSPHPNHSRYLGEGGFGIAFQVIRSLSVEGPFAFSQTLISSPTFVP